MPMSCRTVQLEMCGAPDYEQQPNSKEVKGRDELQFDQEKVGWLPKVTQISWEGRQTGTSHKAFKDAEVPKLCL